MQQPDEQWSLLFVAQVIKFDYFIGKQDAYCYLSSKSHTYI